MFNQNGDYNELPSCRRAYLKMSGQNSQMPEIDHHVSNVRQVN